MNIHKNARLTPLGRERIVRMAADGRRPAEIAVCVGVSLKTVHKWITRVMTDNGSCYKAHAFRDACRDLRLKHIRTKPYTPKTNGKAERFIQTALREWAYARPYDHSDRRTQELPRWLHHYNWHRPHGGIQAKTPISRLALNENNLLRLHI